MTVKLGPEQTSPVRLWRRFLPVKFSVLPGTLLLSSLVVDTANVQNLVQGGKK